MPLTLVRSEDNQTLWTTCTGAFLDELGGASGPGAFASFLWIRNRGQRDLLLEAAEERGFPGWLSPPFTFLGDLSAPRHFALGGRTVGLLTRRRLVSRIASAHARANDITGLEHGSGVVRGHMLDRLIGELLPNGITPDRLEQGLAAVASDDFARRRNAWVAGVYRDYLAELEARGLYDFRQTNALLAARVDDGRLAAAIDGARRLHIYGLHTPRDRIRLIESLHAQRDVDVRVYVLAEEEPGEWSELERRLGLGGERVRARTRLERVVQPAPNPRRELGWIAQQVKETLLAGHVEPHQIAIVARTGREDVRRAYDALADVGVPVTARIRTPLAEIPALRTLLEVFHGVASGWDYRALRAVLSSPYFALGVDLRWVDYIAARRRPARLADWRAALQSLIERKKAPRDPSDWQAERDLRQLRVPVDRLEHGVEALDKLAARVDPLARARSESEWVALALELVERGWSGFRQHLSRPPDERYDVVRVDQRGLTHLEELLREWGRLDLDPAPLEPADWYTLLRRLLESHELALATPLQKGVQILEAHDAALTPFERVYILHANDGIFPARPAGGGVITEFERERLRDALPFDDHERELRRERTLWRAVAANPFVAATFRTTDAAGTPLLPSLMVFELLPKEMHAQELMRSFDPLGDPLNPDQANLAAARELAWAIRKEADATAASAADAAPRGTALGRVRAIDPHVLQHALLNAYAEQERGARGNKYVDIAPPPNPWNGEIRHAHVHAVLRERFGEDHAWSPSALEQYAKSPFLFLLDRVLYLSGLGEADEDTTALVAGSISHEVLQLFYQSYAGGERPYALEGETLERLRSFANRVIEQRLKKGEWLGTPVLWEVKRAALAREIEQYVAWELIEGFEGNDCPVLCEYELGAKEPIVIEARALDGVPRRLRIRGRIDRVDRCGERWRVVDYKTSNIPGKIDFRRGVALQGPLYMQGLAIGEGKEVGFALYRSLRKHAETKIAWGSKEFSAALAIAVSIPDRVRRGIFDVSIAPKEDWRDWDPGIEVRRSSAVLEDGVRFDV